MCSFLGHWGCSEVLDYCYVKNVIGLSPLFSSMYSAKFHFSLKDFMEQQPHGFSDSTPKAGSDRLQKYNFMHKNRND